MPDEIVTDLLVMLNETLRDQIGAPVLIVLLVLFLMGVANLAGWFFDEACGWYDRYSRWREMRQASQYHAEAARQRQVIKSLAEWRRS